MEWLKLGLLILGAYLLGSIPFGLLIGLRLGRDPRQHGSGKTGATNMLRVLGKRAAGAVFGLDAAKGALAVLAARLIPWPDETWMGLAMGCAVAAVILGHIWSIWIRLFTGKWGGGRGVATAVGATLLVHPLAALIGLIVGVAVIGISRYVSLGSIIGVSVGVLAVVVFAFLQQVPFGFLPWGLGMGLLIIGIHRDNIERLMKGTERKIGQRA